MRVIDYLNNLCNQGSSAYTAIGILETEYGVKITINEKYPLLYCLNYNQIESPKFDPIVKECRSLVLGVRETRDNEEFYVVSKSFDRFFNLGEVQEKHDITAMRAFEKVDGSLVSVFYYKGECLYRTRSMIMPEEELKVNGSGLSWKELIESTIFSKGFPEEDKYKDFTFIFEVVSPENRVVTRYPKRDCYLLAVRRNNANYYLTRRAVDKLTDQFCWERPKAYKFDSLETCLESAKSLRELEEGYVLYEQDTPKVKVKNPAYVAAQHLRGEGSLSNKRIMDLIIIEEADEYLSIFPEDEERVLPYKNSLYNALKECEIIWEEVRFLEDQKEFALKVKDYPFAGILFTKRKKHQLTFRQIFDNMTNNAKYRLIEEYVCKHLN